MFFSWKIVKYNLTPSFSEMHAWHHPGKAKKAMQLSNKFWYTSILLTMSSLTESFNILTYPLHENEQKEREIIQWRLLEMLQT